MNEVTQVTDLIDRLGAPECMSKTEWIDFCEQISEYCISAAEAAREELQ